ncbi:MAG: hypothetical protein EOO70_02955 [Myxococcaceae bacterium]|nr:MAG: hypothetical protein EOO70_02955 [Myxococcaceae bacterium]
MRRARQILVAVAVTVTFAFGLNASAEGFTTDGIVYDGPNGTRSAGGADDEAVQPFSSGASILTKGPKAADGTPMLLTDGSFNPPFTHPPKGYRSPEGYQQARWGMSLVELKKLYPGAGHVEASGIALNGKTAGLETVTVFRLVGDKLVLVIVTETENRSSAAADLQDYERLKRLLTRRYGEPLNEEEAWSSDLFRGDPARRANAIKMKTLVLKTTWMTGETMIILEAEGEAFGIKSSVSYLSARLGSNANEAADAADASEL